MIDWNDSVREKILRKFSSNIRIKITGRNVNNFIRRLIKCKINVVRVIPISYKEMDIIIDYKDLERIERLRFIYDIEITSYYGKLKVLKFIKKNIYIFSFLIVGLICVYVLSNMVFDIEVIHSNGRIVKLIEKELNGYGIKKYGFVKSYSDIEKIEEMILDNNKEDIEWLEIVRDGTKYIVRVEERIINRDVDDDRSYDVVASKNAVIKYIIAYEGEKVREVNTYVREGDVIISSDITLPNNTKIKGSASGKVVGETWYTIDTEYPYYYNEVLYTGNKKKVLVFNFINKRISLFDFDKYKSFDKNIKYIFSNNFIPISLIYEYQYETNVINENYSYEEAKEKAIELAKKRLLDKYKNIIDINKVIVVKEEDKGSKIGLTLFISCDEDITRYMEVSLEEMNE